MKYTALDYSNGFTLNMTSKVMLPDVDYINELAVEKNFTLNSSFTSAPKLLEDLYSLFKKENECEDEFDAKQHIFSKEYLEKDVLFRPLSQQEEAYYDSTVLFLAKINFSNTIGLTPLDKSLNVMMYLIHLSSKTNPPESKYANKSLNDPTPQNIEVSPEQLQEALQEMGQGIQRQDDDVAAPGEGGASRPGAGGQGSNQTELSEDITSCVREHLGDLSPSIAHIYGQKKPSDVPINRKILSDIKIKAYLENSKGMETSKERKKKRNNQTNQKDRLQMEEHSQITKVRKSSMAMENFEEKFVKKEVDVKEKMKPEERKQALYMLLDDSGSMRCKIKQTYVRAVLLNRLESVVDGNGELIFSLYESERYDRQEVKTIKDAQELYKKISLRRPSGGGTYIGNVLQQTVDELKQMQTHHSPEIMIVCDGDDHVDPSQLKSKGVKINVVLLGTNNKGLEQIAKETGGFCAKEKLYNR